LKSLQSVKNASNQALARPGHFEARQVAQPRRSLKANPGDSRPLLLTSNGESDVLDAGCNILVELEKGQGKRQRQEAKDDDVAFLRGPCTSHDFYNFRSVSNL